MLVISDAHVMAQSLVKNQGSAYTSAMDANRKMLAESEGIYNQLVDTIIKYKPDVVLFPGDMTKDGEKASHEVFVEGLKKIEKNGIVCLVIPGNHDYNNPSSVYYDGAASHYADALNEAEFATMYKDYGYGNAATRDTSSLSFYTDEFDHLRIIGIDATRNRENTLKEWGASSNKSFGDGLMRPNTLKWVLDRADEADKQGRMVLVMVHHQMLQHFDNEDEMFSSASIQNGEDIAKQFIDHKIRVVLTGHMHINNITKLYNTAKTDSIIEISTGSPIEYPGCWRWLSLNKGRNTLTVNTRYIASIKEADDFMLYGREHLSKHDDLLWGPFSTKLWEGMAKSSIADADLKTFLKLLTDNEATYKPLAKGYLSEPLKLIMLTSAEANENHKYGQLLLTMMSDSLDAFAKKVMTDNSYSAFAKMKVSAALKMFGDAAFEEALGSLITDCSYRGTKNENTTNDLYLTVSLPNPNGYVVKNTVNFVDWDGKILKTQEVGEGGAATAPADPTREGYTFTGWDTDYSVVNNDLTVTAQYKINSYTVTFVDKDGKEISKVTVEYGSAATAPTAPAVEGYDFTGWDKDFSKVTGNITVKAQYAIKTFTVTFKDYDGKELSKQTVDWGKSATAPKNPSREGYTFTGWDKEFSSVKSDLTVTAQYKINTYTVTFKDYDGKEISKQTVDWGKGATAPKDPTREGYTFTGWDKEFSSVKSDLTVTAQYKINSYTVTFVDKDGKELSKQTVEWGKSATAPTAPAVEGYDFTGWDKDFSKVTGNITVKAQYAVKTFTVTFKDYDGKELSKQTVDWGKSATAPKNPTREGYTFSGWDKEFSNVKSDLTVTAQYKINNYTVTFVDKDGKELSKQTVEWGKSATAPTAPVVEGYDFSGWDTDFSKVTSNITVKAQYKAKTYTVTFKDFDGKVLKEQTVDWGKAATAPADPTREGYTFIGWSPADFSSVKENMTVTAQYSKDAVVYTVTFVDWNGSEILTVKVIEGNGAEKPADPERYGYTFTGWDKDFSKVTSDLTVTAQYKINSYTVTFLDKDGNVIAKETVEYGSSVTAPEAPVVEGYTFTGWDRSITKITGDMTVIALYKINTYTVTFVGKDGKEISKETVEHGSAATAPEAPVVEGFEFKGWDVDFSKVTSNLTVTALYEAIAADYTPANLKVVKEQIDKDTKITFSWDAVEGAASYELQLLYLGLPLYTTNTSSLHEIPLMLSELLNVITGVDPGTYTLGWQVRSLDAESAPLSEWAKGEDFEVVIDFGTGLETVNGETNVRKVMRNGRVVIISDKAEYNAAGARVK